jgi:prepilin-type N-terminal cleavage/methylation domain-containing protein
MNHPNHHPRVARRAFTLLELLVVMGILLVLATLTVISVGKVTRDAKLANATNTVVAALGTARAIAIRDNAYVMVTFRVAPDRRAKALPREPQIIQVVTARWTGEVVTANTPLPIPNPTGAEVMEHVLKGKGREVGFGAITEILLYKEKGLRFVGPLPPEIQNYTSYTASVMSAGTQKEGAQALVKFLGGPVGKPLFVAAGIE